MRMMDTLEGLDPFGLGADRRGRRLQRTSFCEPPESVTTPAEAMTAHHLG